MVGAAIAHYEITAMLGEGERGVVYEAEDLLSDRTTALEFLVPGALEAEQAMAGFLREARTAVEKERLVTTRGSRLPRREHEKPVC